MSRIPHHRAFPSISGGVRMNERMLMHWFDRRLTAGACFVLTALASGCGADVNTPPAPPAHVTTSGPPTFPPSPPATPSAFIWAMVVDPSGICIAGATIQVVSGPGAGQTFVQDSDCDAWAYSGGVWFGNLVSGVTMTLRASAVGYNAMEKTAVAASSGQAVEFDLSPLP